MKDIKELRTVPSEDMEKEGYSPALTEKVKRQAVSEIVQNGRELLLKSPTRIDLRDTEALIQAVDEYLQRCIRIGTLPTLQGVASVCGVSRRYLYKFLDENPESQSGQYLEKLRSSFTTWRIEAADKSAAREVLTIFLLKNSSQGYVDRHDFAPAEPENPLKDLDVAAARQRLIDSVPDEDDL